jgi:hypothetical protein
MSPPTSSCFLGGVLLIGLFLLLLCHKGVALLFPELTKAPLEDHGYATRGGEM